MQANKTVMDTIHLITHCGNTCEETIAYCLQKGGQYASASRMKLLLDCTEICRACVNYMLRNSEFKGPLCGLCADVCQRCAESCASFTDDQQLQNCAGMCKRCADACWSMAKA